LSGWPLCRDRLWTRRAAPSLCSSCCRPPGKGWSARVAAAEADRLLGVIAARVATGQTGAVWQRRALAALEPRLGRERALAATLERYLDYAATDQPVHSWPTGRS